MQPPSLGWILTVASLLVVVAAGRVAGRVARKSAPELVVLLNQSAAFYRRWPEHRHGSAPAAELMVEAARCQRIIQLLEAADLDGGPAARGPIDGLRAWITLLHREIRAIDAASTGPVYT